MELLRNTIQRIADGERSFSPENESEEAFKAFQPVANRLEAAKSRNLIRDVKFQRSRSRDRDGTITAMVIGGLTFEGEELLNTKPQTMASNRTTPLGGLPVKLFISHCSADEKVAEAFVALIRAAFSISPSEIRCTSVAGHKYAAGTNFNEQLRVEVFESDAFVALISPSSLKSMYVLFEMGARWGSRRYLAPIRISGTMQSMIEAPLSATNVIGADSEPDIHQLLETLADKMGVKLNASASYIESLHSFIHQALPPV